MENARDNRKKEFKNINIETNRDTKKSSRYYIYKFPTEH